MSNLSDLAALIERITGNVIPEREMSRLESVALDRAAATGQEGVAGYVRYLSRRGDSDEWRALLRHITINESYLFRGAQQFRALTEKVLGEMLRGSGPPRLSVWSAGCARGEEPATIAIVLAEALGVTGDRWQILATDVDDNVLDDARSGVFGRRAVAKVPQELLERYFDASPKGYRLDERLQRRISYRTANLIDLAGGVDEAPFDVVFLRNVLIYFRPAAQREVAGAVATTLSDRGVLFVGPSESLWQLHTGLQPWDLGDCFCYRKAGAPSDTVHTVGRIPRARRSSSSPPESRLKPRTADSDENLSIVDVATRLQRLLQADRATEAVQIAAAASRQSPDDAALRALEGRVRELTGDLRRAVASYRAALYLEPRYCVVRFLRAVSLDALGRHGRARAELRAVLAMLAAASCRTPPELEILGVPTLDEIGIRSRTMLEAD